MGTFSDLTPENTIQGSSDGTEIGNVQDALKVNLASIGDTTLNSRDIVHQNVHEGISYIGGHVWDAVNNNDEAEILIKVGANKSLHFLVNTSAEGDFYAYLFEAPTVTSDGTLLTVSNLNRSSSNTTDASAYHTPTTTADGTQIGGTAYIPGGEGGNSTGGSGSNIIRVGQEIILKKSTNYLIRITNKAGQAKKASINFSYYESTF